MSQLFLHRLKLINSDINKWMTVKSKMLLCVVLYWWLDFSSWLSFSVLFSKVKFNKIWFYSLSFVFKVPWSILLNNDMQAGLFNGRVRNNRMCLVKEGGW